MTGADSPPGGLSATEQDELLRAAVAAPSLHNSQPWQFAVTGARVEVWTDPARHLRHADPAGRSLLISIGAAVLNLRVAAEHLGLRPDVRLVVPDPFVPDAGPVLVVTVDLGDRSADRGPLAGLHAVLAARRTNRRPFRDEQVLWPELSELRDAARDEHAVLNLYQAPGEVARIVELLRTADEAERQDVAIPGERAAWIGGPGRDDGIPVRSLGPRPVDARTGFRDLGAGIDAPRDYAVFERAPTLAVLATEGDGPADWLEAGQALQRLLLVATREGLAASFMNQALERPDVRAALEPGRPLLGHPQMVLRLGYGEEVPPTPRRPVSSVRRDRPGSA